MAYGSCIARHQRQSRSVLPGEFAVSYVRMGHRDLHTSPLESDVNGGAGAAAGLVAGAVLMVGRLFTGCFVTTTCLTVLTGVVLIWNCARTNIVYTKQEITSKLIFFITKFLLINVEVKLNNV